jgi:hypothetical protein
MKVLPMKAVEILKSTKKIGIIIHSGSHLFSSGIIQNAYFNYQCFEHMGLKPEFLCFDENPKAFGYKDLKMKQIVRNDKTKFEPSDYFMVMTVTRSMDTGTYEMFKNAGVAVCAFICGNCIMFDQEDFCRGSRGQATFIDSNSKADQLWIIPSFWSSHDYLETIRRTPSFVVPHLWSHEIIKEFTPKIYNKPELDLFYDPRKHKGKKINILILESNMALLKNAWVPMVACEKLHQQNPDLIDCVYVFNYPKDNLAWQMGDSLTLDKDKKLRRFARLSFPEILLHFNSLDSIPIILSYQVNNTLNYLYYEFLHYGYPLVHNSPDLEKCGYYFPDFNIAKCVDQLIIANASHEDNFEKYKKDAKKYLKRVDPLDSDVCKKWEERINHLMLKKVNDFLKEKQESKKEESKKEETKI